MKAMAEDGVLGIFKGGFTASAVGISGALVFGYLGAIIFTPDYLDDFDDEYDDEFDDDFFEDEDDDDAEEEKEAPKTKEEK